MHKCFLVLIFMPKNGHVICTITYTMCKIICGLVAVDLYSYFTSQNIETLPIEKLYRNLLEMKK
jgi:hypothetical protein